MKRGKIKKVEHYDVRVVNGRAKGQTQQGDQSHQANAFYIIKPGLLQDKRHFNLYDKLEAIVITYSNILTPLAPILN